MKYEIIMKCYEPNGEFYCDKINKSFETKLEAENEMLKAVLDELYTLNSPDALNIMDRVFIAEKDDNKENVINIVMWDGKDDFTPVTTYSIGKEVI